MYRHIQYVYLAVFEAVGHRMSLLLMSYNLCLVAFPDLLTMVYKKPYRFQITPNVHIVTV